MIIKYASTKLEKILTNERLIRKHYTNIHVKLMNRVSELYAANNLGEISETPPPRRHKLYGERQNCWGIDVSKNYRLIVQPIGEWDNSDIKTIKEIKVISIEDYH